MNNGLNELNILHLTDLHFSKEINPTENPTQYAEQQIALEKIINTLKAIEDKWKPHLIVISGDVGWSGKSDDYVPAKDWLLKLVSELKLSPEKIIISSGNHDLDRQKIHGKPPLSYEDADEWLKIEKIDNFVPLFSNLIDFQKELKIPQLLIGTKENYIIGQRIIEGIRFIVLNSAWYSWGDNDKGNLWIGLPQLVVMENHNQLIHPQEYNSKEIVIIVIHHPKEWYHEQELDYFNNRPPSYNYFAKRSHIILSGHTHTEFIDDPDRICNCAWLFTNGASYAGTYYRNNFSILKINKKERSVKRRVFYYESSSQNWVEREAYKKYSLRIPPSPPTDEEIKKVQKIEKFSIPASNLKRNQIKNIHQFLDDFNNFLEGDFSIIKLIYYPNTWKIGIIIYGEIKKYTTFSLYPIPWELNDVAIKELPLEMWNRLTQAEITSTRYSLETTEIMQNSKDLALDFIFEKLWGLIINKDLNHDGIRFLEKEFIFASIDKFHKQFGLEKKNQYTIEEIEYGLYTYLPIWVEEKIKTFPMNVLNNLLKRKKYLDPISLSILGGVEATEQVESSVKERIAKNQIKILKIPIGNSDLPFGVLEKSLYSLKAQNLSEIDRIYHPPDYSRLKKGDSSYNAYTQEEIKENIEIFFKNLPDIYQQILDINFPIFSKNLPLFNGATTILIELDLKESYSRDFLESPAAIIYGLKRDAEKELRIIYYEKSENKMPPRPNTELREEGVEFDGKLYEIASWQWTRLDFIFKDSPLLNYVYNMLWGNLNEHFNRDKIKLDFF